MIYSDTDFAEIPAETEAVVPLGTQPRALAVSHDGARVYVALDAGWISVIDTRTSAVVSNFELGGSLCGIAVSEDDSAIYVADDEQGNVLRIDATGGEIENRIRFFRVNGLCTAGRGRLHVASAAFDCITTTDETLASRAEITAVGNPFAVASSPDGRYLYVVGNGDRVIVLDTATVPFDAGSEVPAVVDHVIETMMVPRGLALNPSGSRLYVAHPMSDRVSVIDTAARSVVGTIPVPEGNTEGVAVSPDGRRLYVTNFFGQSVAVLRTPAV